MVNTHKVPRIIGKRGSMVGMIKRATDCNIVVGQNGRVWLNGAPEMEVIAINAIKMIELHSHESGLTDRVKGYLEQATGKTVEVPTEDTTEERGNDRGRGERRGNGGGFRRESSGNSEYRRAEPQKESESDE
jgi:exosome complex RNA-binding protein Rrp4